MSSLAAPPAMYLWLLLVSLLSVPASAVPVPFSWQLDLRVAVGLGSEIQLPSHSGSGIAEVSLGTVSIAASQIVAAVPTSVGFSRTISNGAGAFFSGGVPPRFACPSNPNQLMRDLACVSTGGLGGVLPLSGILQLGQGLSRWGLGGISFGQTASGQTRVVQAAPWTTGFASAWYFLTIDPTPFVLAGRGSFRGLPSTFTGTGLPGFSLVTPMVAYSPFSSPAPTNARGIATLSISFVPEPRVLALVAVSGLALGVARRLTSGS